MAAREPRPSHPPCHSHSPALTCSQELPRSGTHGACILTEPCLTRASGVLRPYPLPSSSLGSDTWASICSAHTCVPSMAGVGKGSPEEAGLGGSARTGGFCLDEQEGDGHSRCQRRKRDRFETPDSYTHELPKSTV